MTRSVKADHQYKTIENSTNGVTQTTPTRHGITLHSTRLPPVCCSLQLDAAYLTAQAKCVFHHCPRDLTNRHSPPPQTQRRAPKLFYLNCSVKVAAVTMKGRVNVTAVIMKGRARVAWVTANGFFGAGWSNHHQAHWEPACRNLWQQWNQGFLFMPVWSLIEKSILFHPVSCMALAWGKRAQGAR